MDWLTDAELQVELSSSQTRVILKKSRAEHPLVHFNGLHRNFTKIPAFVIKHFRLNKVESMFLTVIHNSTSAVGTHSNELLIKQSEAQLKNMLDKQLDDLARLRASAMAFE